MSWILGIIILSCIQFKIGKYLLNTYCVPSTNLENFKTRPAICLQEESHCVGKENVVSAMTDELKLTLPGVLINIFNLSPFKALIDMLNKDMVKKRDFSPRG